MTERAFTKEQAHGRMVVTWTGVLDGDTLAPYEPPSGYDLDSIQVTGAFDSQNLDFTGSNDGTNYASVIDSAFTAAGVKAPTAQTEKYSGAASAGPADMDVDVITRFSARN